MTTSAPIDPYVRHGQGLLGTLLDEERRLPTRLAGHVDVICEQATALAASAASRAKLRRSLEALAETLTRTGSSGLTVPPARIAIPDSDPDGLLWAALETCDAASI